MQQQQYLQYSHNKGLQCDLVSTKVAAPLDIAALPDHPQCNQWWYFPPQWLGWALLISWETCHMALASSVITKKTTRKCWDLSLCCATLDEMTIDCLEIQTSSDNIVNLLSSLDCRRAPGPDNILTWILKQRANILVQSVTAFPKWFIFASMEVVNYRQISLINCFQDRSKVCLSHM